MSDLSTSSPAEVDDGTPDASEGTGTPDTPAGVRLYGVPVTTSLNDRVLHPSRSELVSTVTAMKADGFGSIVDLFGVDYLEHPGRRLAAGVAAERFEVVVILIRHATAERIRLRVQVPESDATVDTLFDVFPGSEALEREVYDMYGITFNDHPDMTRILMPDGWEGHPLRKDFDVGSVPVQFKAAPAAR